MNEISTGRRVFSIILLTIGALSLIGCYICYVNSHFATRYRHNVQYDWTQLTYAGIFGIVGLLFLAFGYEPYLKRREEELDAGIIPDDDKYWETKEFPGPHV